MRPMRLALSMTPTPRPHRFLAALLVPAALVAQEPSLTERDAVKQALARPEHQAIAALPEAEASALLRERRIRLSPSVEWTREKFEGAGPGRREDTWLLTQPLDLSGRKGLQREAAERRLDASRADRQLAQAQLAARVREAFFDVVHAQRRLMALEAASTRVQRLADAITRQAQAGEASGADQRRIRREAEHLVAQRTEAALAQTRALAALQALLGGPASLPQGELIPDAPASWVDTQARYTEGPSAKAWTALEAASSAEARSGRRWAPELTLGAGVKRWQEPGIQGNGTVVSLGFTFPQWNRIQADRQRADARAQATQAEVRLARDTASGELKTRWEEASRLREASLRFEKEAANEGARLLQSLEAAYQAGEASLFELLETQRNVVEGDLESLALALRARKARIALDQMLGKVEP